MSKQSVYELYSSHREVLKVPKAAAGDVHPRRRRPILVSVVVAVVGLSRPLV